MPKLDTETARSIAKLKSQLLMDQVTVAEKRQRIADTKAQLKALKPASTSSTRKKS